MKKQQLGFPDSKNILQYKITFNKYKRKKKKSTCEKLPADFVDWAGVP